MEESITKIIDKYLANQEQDYKRVLILFIILAALFFASMISNAIVQIIINKQILKNETKKIKLERKILLIEELYKKLNEIKMLSIVSISDENLKQIKEINSWISQNRINLTTGIYTVTMSILDYFIEIYTAPHNKDIRKEKKLFDRFIQEYESI